MKRIDTALEKRVWQRVYGRQPDESREYVSLGQLAATARDCALLCRSLRLESRGQTARNFEQMERRLSRAATVLADASGEREQIGPPVGCPGCSRQRRLELLRLWLTQWSSHCREYSGNDRRGGMLAEMARMGDIFCRSLGQRG